MKTNINILNDLENLRNTDVFKTPEGYFDSLSSRIMDQIPAEDAEVGKVVEMSPKKHSRWYVWTSAAACFVAIIGIGSLLLFNDNKEEQYSMEDFAEMTNDDFEDVMDYTMVDNGDVYCYLAGESY